MDGLVKTENVAAFGGGILGENNFIYAACNVLKQSYDIVEIWNVDSHTEIGKYVNIKIDECSR